jgi:hypothetical protein
MVASPKITLPSTVDGNMSKVAVAVECRVVIGVLENWRKVVNSAMVKQVDRDIRESGFILLA